jgi:hypothetical protein
MADLANMNRDDLNAHAAELGFPDPGKFPGTKAELIAALEEFTADGTVPDPQVEETSGDEAQEAPDTLIQDVKAYLRAPTRVKPPAAVINFGADRPIRASEE